MTMTPPDDLPILQNAKIVKIGQVIDHDGAVEIFGWQFDALRDDRQFVTYPPYHDRLAGSYTLGDLRWMAELQKELEELDDDADDRRR